MDSRKLKKRKKHADKPKRIFEELNRPVTYILDDVKESKLVAHWSHESVSQSEKGLIRGQGEETKRLPDHSESL